MGFGTLFIGYFLLLNVTNYALTDLICALVMALGLFKLSSVNKHFKNASFSALAFAAVGLVELVLIMISILAPQLSISLSFIPIIRSAVICMTTVLILLGIRDVAVEVELPTLSARAQGMIPAAAVIYLSTIILDTPMLFTNVEPIVAAAIFTVVLIATLFLVVFNLITIYSAYMKICMPSYEREKNSRSKPGFFDRLKEHEKMRNREYSEYLSQKNKNKDNKK